MLHDQIECFNKANLMCGWLMWHDTNINQAERVNKASVVATCLAWAVSAGEQ